MARNVFQRVAAAWAGAVLLSGIQACSSEPEGVVVQDAGSDTTSPAISGHAMDLVDAGIEPASVDADAESVVRHDGYMYVTSIGATSERAVYTTASPNERTLNTVGFDDGNTATETECPYGTPVCARCNSTCSAVLNLTGRFCGDGIRDFGEVCDDGNKNDCDGCSNACTVATCP